MAIPVKVDIVSLEREIFSGLVELITVSGLLGEMGIQYGHAPLLSALKPGMIKVIKQGGSKEYFYISGGLIEVQPKHVTILADSAEAAQHLDEAGAIEAKKQAEKMLANRTAGQDYSTAAAELSKAVAQLQVIQRLRKTKR